MAKEMFSVLANCFYVKHVLKSVLVKINGKLVSCFAVCDKVLRRKTEIFGSLGIFDYIDSAKNRD